MKQSNLIIVGLLLAAIASLSIYTVYESDRAIILRLGKLQFDDNNKPQVVKPGLHFKVPFIDEVRKFDMRTNMLDIKSSRIVTSEKKDVLVDFFIQWRIEDLALFYTRTDGQRSKAETLLSQKGVDGLRAEFGRRTIKEVVSGERVELMEKLRKLTDENANILGITVIDVRVKRIDLPDEVSGAVYDRMRSERERVASELKAIGEAEAIFIRAEAEKKRTIMLAEAEQEAKAIRGAGDAHAVKVYATSYGQSPKFFEFYRSLNAYKNAFAAKSDVLVLRPDSEFFKYFNEVVK